MDSKLLDKYSDYAALHGEKASLVDNNGSKEAKTEAEAAVLLKKAVAESYNVPVTTRAAPERRRSASPIRRGSSLLSSEASSNLAPGRRASASPVGRRESFHGQGAGVRGSSSTSARGGAHVRGGGTNHNSSRPAVVLTTAPGYHDPAYVNAAQKANLRKSYRTRMQDTFKPIDAWQSVT